MIYSDLHIDGDSKVSLLSLGSWNTFSRLEPAQLAVVLDAAHDLGVNLLDVGYYWDKPDTEQVLASAFLIAGVSHADFLLSLKVWLWDYPEICFSQQVKASLSRLRTSFVDLCMVSRPTPHLEMDALIDEATGLIAEGLTRGWGVTNWAPEQLDHALRYCRAKGLPEPALIQLQYNPMRRAVVESADYRSSFEQSAIGLCASFMLEGGILAGHLERDRVNPDEMSGGMRPVGRNIARDAGGIRDEIRRLQPRLAEVANDFGVTPAQLCIAFCTSHPYIKTGLVGVTTTAQLAENVRALELLPRANEIREALNEVSITTVGHPRLFNPNDPKFH